jgi:hypothetical protein
MYRTSSHDDKKVAYVGVCDFIVSTKNAGVCDFFVEGLDKKVTYAPSQNPTLLHSHTA